MRYALWRHQYIYSCYSHGSSQQHGSQLLSDAKENIDAVDGNTEVTENVTESMLLSLGVFLRRYGNSDETMGNTET